MSNKNFEDIYDDVINEGFISRWVDRYNSHKNVKTQLKSSIGQKRSSDEINQMRVKALIDSAITRYKIKATNVISDKLFKLIDKTIGRHISNFINNETTELKKDLNILLRKYGKNDKNISVIPEGVYNDLRGYYEEYYNTITEAHKTLSKKINSYSFEKNIISGKANDIQNTSQVNPLPSVSSLLGDLGDNPPTENPK